MSKKILVVDDEVDLLKLMALNLTENGFSVMTAENGKEAMAKFETEKPDLVIVDVLLPDTDGYEICRRIKQFPDTTAKVIMFTGKVEGVDVPKARRLGADDFVGKTQDLSAIVEAVQKVLS